MSNSVSTYPHMPSPDSGIRVNNLGSHQYKRKPTKFTSLVASWIMASTIEFVLTSLSVWSWVVLPTVVRMQRSFFSMGFNAFFAKLCKFADCCTKLASGCSGALSVILDFFETLRAVASLRSCCCSYNSLEPSMSTQDTRNLPLLSVDPPILLKDHG